MVNHRRDRRIAGVIIDVFDAEVVEWDESAGSKFREERAEPPEEAAQVAPAWEEVTLPGVAETIAGWKVPNTLKDMAREKKQGKRKGTGAGMGTGMGGQHAGDAHRTEATAL